MTSPVSSGSVDLRRAKIRKMVWGGATVAGALGLVLGAYSLLAPGPARARGAGSRSTVSAAQTPATATAPASQPSSGAASESSKAMDAGVNAPASPNVKVVLRTVPAVNASVTMGKTRLGTIAPRAPLVLERRRDSGPLDIVIRSAGYIPVHTRAYTFDDNVVEVRLTPLDKKNTLYGYREPLPPEEDAGVPPPPPPATPDSPVPAAPPAPPPPT